MVNGGNEILLAKREQFTRLSVDGLIFFRVGKEGAIYFTSVYNF